jgi:hypothetical protein
MECSNIVPTTRRCFAPTTTDPSVTDVVFVVKAGTMATGEKRRQTQFGQVSAGLGAVVVVVVVVITFRRRLSATASDAV